MKMLEVIGDKQISNNQIIYVSLKDSTFSYMPAPGTVPGNNGISYFEFSGGTPSASITLRAPANSLINYVVVSTSNNCTVSDPPATPVDSVTIVLGNMPADSQTNLVQITLSIYDASGEHSFGNTTLEFGNSPLGSNQGTIAPGSTIRVSFTPSVSPPYTLTYSPPPSVDSATGNNSFQFPLGLTAGQVTFIAPPGAVLSYVVTLGNEYFKTLPPMPSDTLVFSLSGMPASPPVKDLAQICFSPWIQFPVTNKDPEIGNSPTT
ncbi:MAG: hypothetical protein JNN30_15035 [Rhodanobacteraceae bacterium]|nr:hypothetical protein [Rhodanobacteraceae bacterium]